MKAFIQCEGGVSIVTREGFTDVNEKIQRYIREGTKVIRFTLSEGAYDQFLVVDKIVSWEEYNDGPDEPAE